MSHSDTGSVATFATAEVWFSGAVLRNVGELGCPDDFAVRAERGRSAGAEMNVHAIAIDDRRG